MNRAKISLLTLAVIATIGAVPTCRAADRSGVTGEYTLPDRSRNLLESQDDYYDAVQRLQDADAAVVRARETAIKDFQSSPEYTAAVKAVDDAFQAFNDKKNPVIADREKNDPVYSRMKSQSVAIDAQIETARQNPATTQEQLEDLYKNRDTFVHEWQHLESDAIERAQLAPLRQAWLDASKKLTDLQEKQRGEVENAEKLKAAVADASDARQAVEQARAAISGPNVSSDAGGAEEPQADDFLRRYNRANFAGNDAWWSYGWTSISNGKAPAGSAPLPGK